MQTQSISHEYYKYAVGGQYAAIPLCPEGNKGPECQELWLQWCLASQKGE